MEIDRRWVKLPLREILCLLAVRYLPTLNRAAAPRQIDLKAYPKTDALKCVPEIF